MGIGGREQRRATLIFYHLCPFVEAPLLAKSHFHAAVDTTNGITLGLDREGI
jgi:hypothetical protein